MRVLTPTQYERRSRLVPNCYGSVLYATRKEVLLGALVDSLQHLSGVVAAGKFPACTEQNVGFLPEGPIDVLEANLDTPDAATAVLGLRPESLLAESGCFPPGRQLTT